MGIRDDHMSDILVCDTLHDEIEYAVGEFGKSAGLRVELSVLVQHELAGAAEHLGYLYDGPDVGHPRIHELPDELGGGFLVVFDSLGIPNLLEADRDILYSESDMDLGTAGEDGLDNLLRIVAGDDEPRVGICFHERTEGLLHAVGCRISSGRGVELVEDYTFYPSGRSGFAEGLYSVPHDIDGSVGSARHEEDLGIHAPRQQLRKGGLSLSGLSEEGHVLEFTLVEHLLHHLLRFGFEYHVVDCLGTVLLDPGDGYLGNVALVGGNRCFLEDVYGIFYCFGYVFDV